MDDSPRDAQPSFGFPRFSSGAPQSRIQSSHASTQGGAMYMRNSLSYVLFVLLMMAAIAVSPQLAAAAPQPDFGPNVLVFDPSMSQTDIQTAVNTIATQQVSNQFGPQRYALLFKPGTYGSSTNPLISATPAFTWESSMMLAKNLTAKKQT